MKPTIMLVDDQIENLDILEGILVEQYAVIRCRSTAMAVERLHAAKRFPSVVLLDLLMPGLEGMDGYQALRYLKGHHRMKDIPIICITTRDTEQQALSMGAADYIAQPFDPLVISLRVHNQILLSRYTAEVEGIVAERIHATIETRDNMLVALADIIEYRSIESGSHVKRVAKYTELILDCLIDDSEYADAIKEIGAEVIVKSVPLHDIGKVGIPDSVLLKPGKLTDEEFEVMKTHTTIGKAIVQDILRTTKAPSPFLKHCSDIVYYHHERFDGTGYPEGIRGTDIPLSARVVCVADVYDALVMKRVYKDAMPHNTATDIIYRESGTHFDPVVVRAFLRAKEQCRQIACAMAEEP